MFSYARPSRPSSSRGRRLAQVAAATAALAVSTTLTGAPAHARVDAVSQSAGDWVHRSFSQGHLLTGGYDDGTGTWVTYTDHGLSLDMVYALRSLRAHPDDRTGVVEAM